MEYNDKERAKMMKEEEDAKNNAEKSHPKFFNTNNTNNTINSNSNTNIITNTNQFKNLKKEADDVDDGNWRNQKEVRPDISHAEM